MAEFMDPNASEPLKKGEATIKLMHKLDDLFEQYLNLLDQYQTARQQLSTQLSSGHMHLAKANFASTSRTRYGQDYYDERMQALRKVTVRHGVSDGEEFVVTRSLESEEHGKSEGDLESRAEDENKAVEKEEGQPKDERTKTIPMDPIRWFGVLVPQPLRSAQSEFIKVVEGPIPRLITLITELRTLEIEIGRTRKSIKKLERV